MKKFLNEFKEFALKGNVMDLAIGVIIGAAFQNVVSALTSNILSPIIGLFVGQNFDGLSVKVLGVTIQYGAFITSVINFIIMAFVVFLIVKMLNKVSASKKSDAAKEPDTQTCPYCCREIPAKAIRCPECTSQLV
jgi:large conductance mechanosensitive channel